MYCTETFISSSRFGGWEKISEQSSVRFDHAIQPARIPGQEEFTKEPVDGPWPRLDFRTDSFRRAA